MNNDFQHFDLDSAQPNRDACGFNKEGYGFIGYYKRGFKCSNKVIKAGCNRLGITNNFQQINQKL